MEQEQYQVHISDAVATRKGAASEKARLSQTTLLWIVLLAAIGVGLLVAILWSPVLVDTVIGQHIASTVLGTNSATATFSSVWFGFAFAIAAGLGNTFTACNCVVFSCIAPLSNHKGQAKLNARSLLLWMCGGIIAVTAIYGIAGAVLDKQIPMLSNAMLPFGQHFPLRLLQSTVVFVILGIVLCYWGLVTLQFASNPFRRWVEARPTLVPLFLGVIVGFFSVGRPYPLFQALFQYASGTGNVLLSAALLALQGLCNVVVMALLFVVLTYGTGGRFERWMQANPLRSRAITAFSLLGGGVFLIAYWGIRLPSVFGIGWFPTL